MSATITIVVQVGDIKLPESDSRQGLSVVFKIWVEGTAESAFLRPCAKYWSEALAALVHADLCASGFALGREQRSEGEGEGDAGPRLQ